jgi:hypothetical protein
MADGAPIKIVGWLGDDNAVYPYKVVGGKPRISATPYGYSIAEGDVSGHVAAMVAGSAVSAGATLTDMWGGAPGTPYCPVLSAAVTMEILGGAQDNAAGTGLAEVEVHYLDGSENAKSWAPTLTGATPVAFPEPVLHIQSVHAKSSGSASTGRATASGNIDIQGTGGGTLYARMPAGSTCAPRFVFRVPAGYTGYWTDVFGFGVALSANSSGVIEIVANQDPESLAVLDLDIESCYFQQGAGSGGGSFGGSLAVPLKFNAGVVVKGRCQRIDGSGNFRGDLFGRGWLE